MNSLDLGQEIVSIITKYGDTYIKITKEESIQKIYDLLTKNILFEPLDEIEMMYIGWYYRTIYKIERRENMSESELNELKIKCSSCVKYYQMALDQGYDDALFCLAEYYAYAERKNIVRDGFDITKYRELIIKNLEIAIEKNKIHAMFNLGYYYEHTVKDIELAIKYYLMVKEKDDKSYVNYNVALFNLGHCYEKLRKKCLENKNYRMHRHHKIDIVKYYELAVDNGNVDAMYYLGRYYKNNYPKKYDLMKEYYLRAIEHGHTGAMNSLANYYVNIEKNYELGEKYYFEAIEKGNNAAMNNLACHYQNHKSNEGYELAKRYYLMAIENKNINAMRNFALYYKRIEQNHAEMKRYYLMGCEYKDVKSFNRLVKYYNKTIKDVNEIVLDEYLIKFINLEHFQDAMPMIFKLFKKVYESKINLIDLHFRYSENGLGYEEAKRDFINHINKKNKKN